MKYTSKLLNQNIGFAFRENILVEILQFTETVSIFASPLRPLNRLLFDLSYTI